MTHKHSPDGKKMKERNIWVLTCKLGHTFPSPIQMGPPGSQQGIIIQNNSTKCPICGNKVIINNSTMRFVK